MFDMCLLNGLNGVHDTYVHGITNKLFCFGCFKRPIYDAREIEILQCHIHIVKIGMVQNLGTKRAQIGHIVVFQTINFVSRCTH